MIDQGTAARWFKNTKIKIGYFNASITNLNGFKYGKQICDLCDQERKVFTLDPNLNAKYDWICIECLESMIIKTTHDTTFGYVSDNLLKGLDNESAIHSVNKESFEEMQRTPNFLSLQGEQWLGHCKDFMDYIGTWEAPDFTQASHDRNGKRLFEKMTEKEDHHLWDDFELDENEQNYTWVDRLYHTFECRHCKIKRGYWEL